MGLLFIKEPDIKAETDAGLARDSSCPELMWCFGNLLEIIIKFCTILNYMFVYILMTKTDKNLMQFRLVMLVLQKSSASDLAFN